MATTTEQRKHKKHWYRTTYDECPVCGAGGRTRERIYGRAPSKWSKKRVVFLNTYDQCIERGGM